MPFLSPSRMAMLRDAVWLAMIPGALLFAYLQTVGYLQPGHVGMDSHAYWVAVRDPATWYTLPPEYTDAYLYSPAFAQLLSPMAPLSWPAFRMTWMLLSAGTLTWLLAPLGWRRGLTLAPFFVTDLLLGNIYTFFAAALVAGLTRWPGALALPLLTKIAPGVVCVWFLVRREWVKAGWAAGATLVIASLSFLIEPAGWMRWFQFLSSASTGERGGPVGVRLLVALALVVWAARLDRAWLLAPALLLGAPVLGGFGGLAVLAAIPRLCRVAPRSDQEADVPERPTRPIGAKGTTVAGAP